MIAWGYITGIGYGALCLLLSLILYFTDTTLRSAFLTSRLPAFVSCQPSNLTILTTYN